jgi:acyl-CoA thioester hydrolase
VAEWIETYRGVVNPWECDVVQHFTIAYYFDRFADATRNFLDHCAGGGVDAGLGHGPVHYHATFLHELRAGTGFHILTGVIDIDAIALRIGHQVLASTSGETVSWVTQTLPVSQTLPPVKRHELASLCLPWSGPRVPDRHILKAARGQLAARDRVKAWEIDESGAMSLPAHIHRFSAASMQTLAAVGMTSHYMQDHRRGYSTFELNLTQFAGAGVGDIIDVTTSVAHLGNSSLRLAHRMTGRDGVEVAFLMQSGVHLDMDARRSTAIPDELRPAIEKLLHPEG